MAMKGQAVRVVAVAQTSLRREDKKTLVEETMERLGWAAAFRPDIACLPETCAGREPEPVPGPTTEKAARWARAHACWVICPLTRQDEACLRNSAVLLNRRGEIAGCYDKIHPTEGELERGIRPGESGPPVFATDFGPIGIQICFDVNWWAEWRHLKEQGARIVFWPSAYPADRQLSALAWRHEYYVVSATMSRASRIYDITGDVLSRSGSFQPWAEATLHLGKRLFEIDYHVAKIRALQKKYGARVEVNWQHDEDWFTLAALDPALSVAALIEEFELLPKREYHARCEQARNRAR